MILPVLTRVSETSYLFEKISSKYTRRVASFMVEKAWVSLKFSITRQKLDENSKYEYKYSKNLLARITSVGEDGGSSVS